MCNYKKKKKEKINEKGSVSYAIIFFYLSVVLLALFAFIVPVLMDFNVKSYDAAEVALNRAEETIQNIDDENIQAALQSAVDDAQGAVVTNETALSTLFQYGWIIILISIALIIFLTIRQNVEQEVV